MTRYILKKYTMRPNGKCEYRNVKVNNKYFFDCETVAEAKEIAKNNMDDNGDYTLYADLGKKMPNGDMLFEGLYKFRTDTILTITDIF